MDNSHLINLTPVKGAGEICTGHSTENAIEDQKKCDGTTVQTVISDTSELKEESSVKDNTDPTDIATSPGMQR